MLRALLATALAALAIVPLAHAAAPVQVVGPTGRTLASARAGSFDYPVGGWVVHVGSTSVSRAGVRLRDVSLLGGRVQAVSVFVPAHGRAARIDGLFVDGHAVKPHVNRLIPLGGADYVITSQAAVAGGGTGLVGLRLSLGAAEFGLAAGSQVLVGLPVAPTPEQASARTPVSAETAASSPLEVLGFTEAMPGIASAAPIPFFSSGPVGRRAVSLAGRFLGVPYVWAGASPVTGFDCSGLTMYVYQQLGISLTHYTGSQIHEGMPVARDRLQPGDLVFFFAKGGVPDHEGMYIGHNEFIHAPHTGDVVKISSLSDPSYGLGYMGAVRPYRSAVG